MKHIIIITCLFCVSCYPEEPVTFTPTDPIKLDSIPVNPFEKAALGQPPIDTVI